MTLKTTLEKHLKKLEKQAKKLKPGSLKGGKSEPSSKAKPGKGGRFKVLEGKLDKEKGVKNPGALAAAIGRAKFGKKKFQAMAKKGASSCSADAKLGKGRGMGPGKGKRDGSGKKGGGTGDYAGGKGPGVGKKNRLLKRLKDRQKEASYAW